MNKFLLISATILCLNTYGNTSLAKNYATPFSDQLQQDTLKYLNDSVISRKNKYQHQKLNVLLNYLRISVKCYTIATGWKVNDQRPISIILFFEDPVTHSKKLGNAKSRSDFLTITFDNPTTYKEAITAYHKSEGAWTDTEAALYGNLLVKDLVTDLKSR